jgi:acetolactate synthase-1/2/3 large subunit
VKGSDVIARILQAEGVEALACFPHSEIIDSAAAVGIRPVMARTERGALHIADGYSRMNDGRKIGVATVQYGPGSENAFGGVAQCHADASPVLYLPTGYPLSQQDVAPNFVAGRNLRQVTKWGETVVDPARLPWMLQHAFAELRGGKPGPVMVETPIDLLNAENDADLAAYRPGRRSSPHPDPRDLRAALDLLLDARRPVLVAGQGIFYAQAWDELRAFAELLQIPVMTTLNGKSTFPEDHPLALGAGGNSRPATVDHFLAEADLIFGIGTSFTRSDYITSIPDGKTIVQITNAETDVGKDYPVALAALGDAKAALAALTAEAKARLGEAGRRGQEETAREVASVRRAFLDRWMPLLTSDEEPINPYRVVWELMGAVDRERTVVTHDAGSPRDQMVPFYEAIVPHGYMGWGKTTQLGLGMGLMLGAKLARPDWLCVNVMGDAAIGMIGMDFETAVRCKLPILTVVLKNSVMGGYSGYLPIATEKHNIHRLGGDYAGVAKALGGYAEEVAKVADLKPALARCIAETEAGRPALLQVLTKEEGRFAKGQEV